MRYRFVSRAKSLIVPKGRQPRRVRLGLYKGFILDADLQHDMQLLLGLWERETYRSIRAAVGGCDWGIDIGAGNGELVLLLLQSRMKSVIAVEPRPEGANAIVRNLRLNGIAADRLKIVTSYVGVSKGRDHVSLDSLVSLLPDRGFIKIDVDGAELDILQSGTECLGRRALDLLVETHSAQLEVQCTHLLEQFGFTCSVIKNAWWRAVLPELRPIPHNRWLWATRLRRFDD